MQIKETLNSLYKLRREWLEIDPSSTEELLNKCPVAETSRRILTSLSTPRARYAYALDGNVTELVKAAYKIVTAYSGCRDSYYIALVDTAYSRGDRTDTLIDVNVLASLNEVTEACNDLEQYYDTNSIAYTKNDTEDNAYIYVPNDLFYNNTRANALCIRPIRVIMHRNSNRNNHINDACTVLANRFIDYINTSPFTIHQFTNEELMIFDAVEIPDVDAFYSMISNLFAEKRKELVDAAERAKQELRQNFVDKFKELANDALKPYVSEGSNKVPLHNGNLSETYKQRAEGIQKDITAYNKEISKLFLELDKVNNELRACYFGKGLDLHAKLVQTLQKLYETPNSFLKNYNLDNRGRLRLSFIAPVLYWEADEVNQWLHSRFENAKYIKVITSKRFQLWCNACVIVSNEGIEGQEYYVYALENMFNLDRLKPDTNLNDFVQSCLDSCSRSDLESITAFEYAGHTIKHGHVGRYSCFGNNESTIIKAFRDGDYDLALNVIIHCVTQINLTDSIVVEWFCNQLSTNTACIFDTVSKEWYTADEALAILESEGN